MKQSRFSEEQIVGVLEAAEAGVQVKNLCRQIGISDATFYHWKAKYGGVGSVSGPTAAPTRRRERTAEEVCGAAGVGPGCAEGRAVKKIIVAYRTMLRKKPMTAGAVDHSPWGGAQAMPTRSR